jgi:D-alanyl-D-alanine carboxypeptidase
MKRILVLALLVAFLIPASAGAQISATGQSHLSAVLRKQARPMAVFVAGRGAGKPYGAAAGLADPAAQIPLTVDTPVRVASNTKTFVAATVLRLWEQGRINLDASVGPLLNPSLDALLRADGYDTKRMTVRQLLDHSGGLFDYARDRRFFESSMSNPGRRWTREELVTLATSWGDPQSSPGARFGYSDTGYILLGDMIERITGQTLAAAVRAQLKFDRLGLRSTYWEIMEAPPHGTRSRARQWIKELEVSNIHASADLYGGGGLVMSARDMATLAAALFEGRVFDRPETLREMIRQGSHSGAHEYRLGVMVKNVSGREYYWHSGFWGTTVYYSPAARIAVAGVTTNRDAYQALVPIVEQAAGISAQSGSASSH